MTLFFPCFLISQFSWDKCRTAGYGRIVSGNKSFGQDGFFEFLDPKRTDFLLSRFERFSYFFFKKLLRNDFGEQK